MIKTKEDLKRYLECDRIATGIKKEKPSCLWFKDKLWKYQIRYRKLEYYYNNRSNPIYYLLYVNNWFVFKHLSEERCCEFNVNTIEEGLVIWHGYNITVSGRAKIGKNFSISTGCCIGQAHEGCPTIGNNIEMGRGSMVLGGINIPSNTTIAAGAVVVKSIEEEFSTWGGYLPNVSPMLETIICLINGKKCVY